MDDLLPLTPGLLISMAVRTDHSFGIPNIWGSLVPSNPCALEDKQIALIEKSFSEYGVYAAGQPIQSQRQEELTGKGFYSPEREAAYCGTATPSALLRAQQLCGISE